MNSKLPPTPDANRSDKGSGEASRTDNEGRLEMAAKNPDKVGQQTARSTPPTKVTSRIGKARSHVDIIKASIHHSSGRSRCVP
ncbi:hypothetical protein SB748_26815 [Rhizobium sp. SIMBA_035]